MTAEERTGGEAADDAPGAVATARPLARFFAYQVVSEFGFTSAIWILYLQQRGFSLGEIGLAESVFHLAPVTLELPSGSFADLLGRKWAMAIGALLVAASAALMLRADSLWILLPAMYLNGASFAFRSGSAQAFLYDSLARGGGEAKFTGFWGRLLSVSYLVVAATSWIGAALADRDFAWPFALAVAGGLAAAWLAAGLREQPRERAARRGGARVIREAVSIVRRRPGLGPLMLFSAGLFTFLALIGLYAQAVLADHGLPPSRVGLVIGLAILCTAAGSWFADRVGGRFGFARWTLLTTTVAVAAGLGLGSGALALAVALYLGMEFVAGVWEPLLAARVNEGLPPAQRATILSVEGFLFSISMIWAFPAFGALAERRGWLMAYGAAGALVLALFVAWSWSGRARPAAAATG